MVCSKMYTIWHDGKISVCTRATAINDKETNHEATLSVCTRATAINDKETNHEAMFRYVQAI